MTGSLKLCGTKKKMKARHMQKEHDLGLSTMDQHNLIQLLLPLKIVGHTQKIALTLMDYLPDAGGQKRRVNEFPKWKHALRSQRPKFGG